MSFVADWLKHVVDAVTQWFPANTFLNVPSNVYGLLAIVLVSLICGAVGSLVVGNRMAFFSDALAHCAFAGVALGLLTAHFNYLVRHVAVGKEFYDSGIPLIMIAFGVLVGIAIVYVREKTALESDSVIGVFFAGAMGFGAMVLKAISRRRYFNPENFLFGDVALVTEEDVLVLLLLALVTLATLGWMYNRLLFASFNSTLARSRRVPVRLCNYLFVVLLALIVNLCLRTVGVLLINALLIVPAATATNLCRNMRQTFWVTALLAVGAGILGHWLSWEVVIPNPDDPTRPDTFGTGGTIVVLSVCFFFLSMLAGPWLRGRAPRSSQPQPA